MILASQDQVYRALRQRVIDAAGAAPSRVYLTTEPNFAEAMDYAVQITPLATGATNEMNRTGLGFVNERFAVTTFVRSASENVNKQTRQIAGIDRGVINRQVEIRKALIQNNLDGLLQIAIRFVSSGPIRQEPRSELYLSATDIFICSYAMAWPVAGKFRYGWSATTPTWAALTGETEYINDVDYAVQANRASAASQYFWFAFPQELHDLGITISTVAGVESFYRLGYPAPAGSPAIGSISEGGVTYQLYRRAYPTVATSLTYQIEAG